MRSAPGAGTLAVLAGLVAAGCAHHAESPTDTVAAFGAAVERKDYEAAYALTSDEFRKRTPLASFRAELEAGGDDTQALGRRLREQAARSPLRVEVDVDLGDKLPLVLDGGRWRIDGQPFELWSQKTPRAALRSFIRALERRRYDVALRLVPNRYRPGLTTDKLRDYWEGERKAENVQLLARLRAALAASAPIVESGDEAHMPYGERYEVRFVREDSVWKVEDPD
jgi:hypothetical protein